MRSAISFAITLSIASLLGALPVAAELDDNLVDESAASTDQQSYVSAPGVEILANIASAQEHLRTNNLQKARSEVAKARTLLGQLRETSPAARIQDRIETALKSLAGGGEAKPDTLLPIYAELDTTEKADEFVDTLTLVNRAKGHIESGDTVSATTVLIEASASINYTEIDLPIQTTYSELTHALLKLTRRDPMGAALYLNQAEAGVQEVSAMLALSETELPAVGAGPAD